MRPAAQEEIRTLLRESHRVEAGAEDFTVRNQSDLASAAESSTRVMTLLLAAIAPLSLLVGGIGGAVGVLFGYYPARKAAALNPIQALRYE